MKAPRSLSILCTVVVASSCESHHPHPQGAVEAKTANSGEVIGLPEAKEVNRYGFVESEILTHPEDEKEFNHLYMGSLDGFDYISVRSNKYRIPSDQLDLEHHFPLSEDPTKWVHMRIHFSQVKYK